MAGDQDKPWAPHRVCHTCVEQLRSWSKGKRPSMPFAIPMVWREPQNHVTDCYFCMTNVAGMSSKTKKLLVYPNLQSAIRPVPHDQTFPIPDPPANFEEIPIEDDDTDEDHDVHTQDPLYQPQDRNSPQPLTQADLNDLVRDLNLPKDAAEVLGSRLKSRN
ncbi:Hypothetical protein NTJ_14621 [Nesidiocoris tenuis]|uniref:Uncharacterized protein n=1 Tax=Nesidiocoris tenuis TaxID=355587 RepID=A0ABN7BBR3_9HEMI|nr:Hypothetical protein NTJ_14621 [Nesidiocoris tenuis]